MLTCACAFVKSQETKLKLVIAGAPACGKGTQCERLIHKFGVVHISTGEILRKAVEDGTEIGLTAKSHMDNGELVNFSNSSYCTVPLLRVALCSNVVGA